MSNHMFTVENPERTVTFQVSPDEAKAALEWLKGARTVQDTTLKVLSPQPPNILNHLMGAFSAIAENRPYGGH